MNYKIGIDPGLDGALAIQLPDKTIEVFVMPLNKIKVKNKTLRFIDNKKLRDLLQKKCSNGNYTVYIEDIHSLHMVSAKSNFSFGFGYGNLIAVLDCLDLDYIKVAPKLWQKNVWIKEDISREPDYFERKKELKQGKIKTKVTSLNAINRLYPNMNLLASSRCTVPHDGIVDALCILHYGIIKD